jgi:D-alanyl-D-alanine carboxypeptidase
LENAYALAGYGVDAQGRDIAFAFIVNAPGVGVLPTERWGAEVLRYLSSEGLQ